MARIVAEEHISMPFTARPSVRITTSSETGYTYHIDQHNPRGGWDERKEKAQRGKENARKLSKNWMTKKDYLRQKALDDAKKDKPKAKWKPRKVDW